MVETSEKIGTMEKYAVKRGRELPLTPLLFELEET
jgi:hypothetical protein